MRSIAMQALTDDIERDYPGVTIWGKGDEAHQEHPSDHNEDDTPGSKPAQTDPDNIPEHRAIDVKVDGVAFTDSNANTVIARVLANPVNRARLKYINYKDEQWNELEGWHDNSHDPHPTHIHFSGRASKDADGSPWLEKRRRNMFCNKGGVDQNGEVGVLQREINEVLTFDGVAESDLLVVDYGYGPKTAAALLRTGCGNPANGGEVYWEGEYNALQRKLRDIAAVRALREHLANAPHGGELPDSIQLTIPSYTVPAQTVVVPIEEGN